MTNIGWPVIRRIFKYCSVLISPFEKRYIKKHAKNVSHPLVFIVGVPRSGSTILYQILSSSLDFLYINNLVNLARESVCFGFWLSQLLFKNKTHGSFSSNYGNTKDHGLNAPSEAGEIWYKWIPRNNIIVEDNSLSEKKQSDFKNTLNAITNKHKKPMLIKNLYFSMRLKLVAKLWPNAIIIFVKRNPLYNAQSIYSARIKNNNNANEWWSVKPVEFEKLKNNSPEKQIAGQVYYIEQQIKKDLDLFPKNQVLELHYEDLQYHLDEIIKQVASLCHVKYRENINFAHLIEKVKIKNTKNLDDKTFELLKQAIEKYEF